LTGVTTLFVLKRPKTLQKDVQLYYDEQTKAKLKCHVYFQGCLVFNILTTDYLEGYIVFKNLTTTHADEARSVLAERTLSMLLTIRSHTNLTYTKLVIG